MSISDFLQEYKILEYIVTGVFGIGLIIFILFSSPIEKLKAYAKNRVRKKRKSQLRLMQEANRKLENQIEQQQLIFEDFMNSQEEFHVNYITGQKEFHSYVEDSFDQIHSTLQQLEDSDREQLRQLMDDIYYKYINEKRIPQHRFDRYQGLYENYKREKGNGKYDAQWAEVQKWEKYT